MHGQLESRALVEDYIARLRPTAPIAFLDVETTGVLPTDEVIQVAILRIEPSGDFEELVSLVSPKRPIPEEAIAVHGITNAMVAAAPKFPVVANAITRLVQGAVLGAFNGRFDVKMLTAEYERAQLENPFVGAQLVDPYVVFVRKEPRDLSAAVFRYAGHAHENAHDAMGDVRATVAVLLGQLAEYDDLPRDTQALATWCLPERDPSWLDPDGKVAWRDGDARLTFGKNAGRTLRDLARHDPSFLRWVLQKDFSDDVKHLVREAINGRFPVAPQQQTVEA